MTETSVEVHKFTREQLAKQARCLAVLDIVGNLVAGNIADEEQVYHWKPDGSLEIHTKVTGIWRIERGEMVRDDQKTGHHRRKCDQEVA
jgi:hypothetical protein